MYNQLYAAHPAAPKHIRKRDKARSRLLRNKRHKHGLSSAGVLSAAGRSRRKIKDITPSKYWRSLSITNYFLEQELLKAKENGKENDDDELERIATDASDMFGEAIEDFANVKSALWRVKRQRARLVKGGWRVRPIKAAVVKV